MTNQTLSLTTFYGGWDSYRRDLAAVIAPLSPEQLALRATPNHWSVGMIAQHIVANRVWWFHGWMEQGSPDLAAIARWDPGDYADLPPREAAELAAAFGTTSEMITAALSRWTAADLEQVFPPPAFLSEDEKRFFGERTRTWIIWHVLEHEIHHGGELSAVLGAHGLLGIYGDM